MTLGLVECRKWADCAQIAQRFEPNTVLWAFHPIQPSSFVLVPCARLRWPSGQLLSARKCTILYGIVSVSVNSFRHTNKWPPWYQLLQILFYATKWDMEVGRLWATFRGRLASGAQKNRSNGQRTVASAWTSYWFITPTKYSTTQHASRCAARPESLLTGVILVSNIFPVEFYGFSYRNTSYLQLFKQL